MHSIRLRHPWKSSPHNAGLCWSRSFNWPAGVLPQEKASLVILGLPDTAVVSLNEKPLAADEAGQFDVTRLLAPHNKLTIEVAVGKPTGATECPFDVRLEIVEK